MKNILIIDTGAGNLFSLKSAIVRLGYKVTISKTPNETNFDGVVIPGQGRFGTVMNNIRKNGWPEFLKLAYENKTPILGICVGMQIFFESSEEDQDVEGGDFKGTDVKGLAWFDGKVEALDFPKKPMVGWAKLQSSINNWNERMVYFVNSFAIKSSPISIAKTFYGEAFCATVKSGSFTGVQFHPEKSSLVGSQIIVEALKNV